MNERMRRVNDAVKEVLGRALLGLKDQDRLRDDHRSGDVAHLRHAKVFVSVLGSEKKRDKSLQGLEAAHGILQAKLAQELRMKRTPQLAFEYDPTVERGVHMTKLIDELAPDDDDRD